LHVLVGHVTTGKAELPQVSSPMSRVAKIRSPGNANLSPADRRDQDCDADCVDVVTNLVCHASAHALSDRVCDETS